MTEKYTAPGPMFEAGPGWGKKLKKWSKKYIFAWDCALCRAARFVVIFGLVFLIVIGPKIYDKKEPQTATEKKISETIQPKDGTIHLARRILARYLAENTEIELTNGQKVFIETALSKEIPDELTHPGNTIEIGTEKIKTAIEKTNYLTPTQLQKWEKYAEGVKFE